MPLDTVARLQLNAATHLTPQATSQYRPDPVSFRPVVAVDPEFVPGRLLPKIHHGHDEIEATIKIQIRGHDIPTILRQREPQEPRHFIVSAIGHPHQQAIVLMAAVRITPSVTASRLRFEVGLQARI